MLNKKQDPFQELAHDFDLFLVVQYHAVQQKLTRTFHLFRSVRR